MNPPLAEAHMFRNLHAHRVSICLCRVGLYVVSGLSPDELADYPSELMRMVGCAQTRSPADFVGVLELEWHS